MRADAVMLMLQCRHVRGVLPDPSAWPVGCQAPDVMPGNQCALRDPLRVLAPRAMRDAKTVLHDASARVAAAG